RWGGFGPTLYRHMLTFVRSRTFGIAAVVLLALGGVAGFLMGDRLTNAGAFIGIAIYIAFFSLRIFRLDFRSDYAVLDYLKTLPVHPVAMAGAAVCAPALASFSLQALPMLGFSIGSGRVPIPLHYIAVLLPANFVWLAVDNALFLRSPYPVQFQGQADPTIAG